MSFRHTRKNPLATARDVEPNVAAAVSSQVPVAVDAEVEAKVTPAIDADLASRNIGFVDEGDGKGHFTVGGVPVSGTLVPPAATWSGVAGRPIISLAEFGAVGDGTYDPDTGTMTGTDNTDAINDALEYGAPVWIPPGMYYYSGILHTDTEGSGLIGSGSRASYLITDQSMDWHLAVVEGTKNTKWTNFSMIGPHIDDGDDYNRAIVIGAKDTLDGITSSPWDAEGTWLDDIVTDGYCVGLHVALAANVQFGTIEVREAGDGRDEPGAYGISCSGSNLRGHLLRVISTDTRVRHGLYYNGPANDCFVDIVEVKGCDRAAVQQRTTSGGGARNGFGRGKFEDCNTNTGETLRGVVHFGTATDDVISGAGAAQIGDYEAINCGGFPGPSLRYMPASVCGTVHVHGHSGDFTTDHFGAHLHQSPNTRLPMMIFVSGWGSGDLNDDTFRGLRLSNSSYCYGGGVRMHSGAIFHRALDLSASDYCSIPAGGLVLDGTYTYAIVVTSSNGLYVADITANGSYSAVVRLAGTTDACCVENVRELGTASIGLISDVSTGGRHSRIMRAPGYDIKTVTTGTTLDVTGYREIRLDYGSATTVTNLTGLQQSVSVRLTALNGNATIAHNSGGAGSIVLRSGSNRSLSENGGVVVSGHVTGTGGSNTYRCIEAT